VYSNTLRTRIHVCDLTPYLHIQIDAFYILKVSIHMRVQILCILTHLIQNVFYMNTECILYSDSETLRTYTSTNIVYSNTLRTRMHM